MVTSVKTNQKRHRTLAHGAWLHECLEIGEGLDVGGGRGIFVNEIRDDTTVLPAGTLLLEEEPLILAENYTSLEAAVLAVTENRMPPVSTVAENTSIPDSETEILRVLGTMYAGPGLQAAPFHRRVRGILKHNMHSADAPPVGGQMPEKNGSLGLWPTACLINHSFSHANVTRSFDALSNVVSYRAIRELKPGDELLDNYVNPRFSYLERAKMMLTSHDIKEERDDFDAPEELLAELHTALSNVSSLVTSGDGERALFQLLPLWERVASVRSGVVQFVWPRDPALCQFFEIFGEAALSSGLGETAIVKGFECAFELLCVREPYSYHSCIVAARIASLANDLVEEEAALWEFDGDEAAAATSAGNTVEEIEIKAARAMVDVRARAARWQNISSEHWRVVFGHRCSVH